MEFTALGLCKDLEQAVTHAGFTEPTPVQAEVIPLVLADKDICVRSKTGTGKTAAFALPILQLLEGRPEEQHRSIKALVLVPTRELAMQVNSAFKVYGRNLIKPPRTVLLVGGLNIDVQIRNLHHGADIAVATPGRLLDLVLRKELAFKSLELLVIDEADKMFDLGFTKELGSVLNLLPSKRQNLLFSATLDAKVLALAAQFMREPVHVTFEEDVPTAEGIRHRAIQVNRTNRGPLLRHLIKEEGWDHVLVFTASIRGADMLTAKLCAAGVGAQAFHGALTQAQRTQVLGEFKSKKLKVLVATDIAARGIDIEKLPHVVNYDLPRSPDDYIHRAGRTARAGEAGTAVTFIGHEDQAHMALIEKRVRMRFTRESIKGFELTGTPATDVKGGAPVKGLRMSKKDKARALAKKAG